MQVDPIKPTLKAPGIERLKPKYDGPLSNFASNFDLRHYTWAEFAAESAERRRKMMTIYNNVMRRAMVQCFDAWAGHCQ